MMRAAGLGLLLVALGSIGAEDGSDTRGVFTAESSRWNVEGSGPTTVVQLQIHRSRKGGHWNQGFPVPIGNLKGLTAAQAQSSGGLVRFTLVRDPGAFGFEGSFLNGMGAGHFTFTPSPAFREELRRMGYGVPSTSELLTLATHGVGRAFIRDLADLGFGKLDLEGLQSLAVHGATPAFIRELKGLGYTAVSLEDLVSLRIQGATPGFIRELKSLGYDRVSVEDLVSLRIHGATPAFIRELKALGYAGVPLDELVAMRIHGVTPEFVRAANRGGKAVPVDRLVEMRLQGEDGAP